MKRTALFRLGAVAWMLGAQASAQPLPPYAAPDAELWGLMAKAISDLPASLSTHQQIQNILTGVQQEARTREARAKAAADAAKPKEGDK